MGFLRAQDVDLRASSIFLLSISEPCTEVNGCGGEGREGDKKRLGNLRFSPQFCKTLRLMRLRYLDL